MWLVSMSVTASETGAGEGAARTRVARRRVRAGEKCMLTSGLVELEDLNGVEIDVMRRRRV
jgi:hypothetical protein